MRATAGLMGGMLPVYAGAALLVAALVGLAPGLGDGASVVLFAIGVAGAAVLPLALAAPHRRSLLLGTFAFSVPFATIDKWFFFRPHNGGAAGIQVSIADLVMVVLFGVWAWESATRSHGDREGSGGGHGAIGAAIGFIALVAVSFISAGDRTLVFLELLQMVKLLLWFVLIAYNVTEVAHLRAMGMGMLAAVAVHATFAAAEKLAGGHLGLGLLGEQQGLSVGLFSGAYTRVGGLVGHPVLLGAFFTITLPFLLAMVVNATSEVTRRYAVAGVLAGASGLALTLSRGAAVAWVAAFALFTVLVTARGWALPKARSSLAGLGAAVIAACLVASPVIVQRFVFSDPGSVAGRTQLNAVALRVIAQHPGTGVGLNNWSRVMAAYDTTGISLLSTDPVHNVYLLLLAETGVIGLLGFALFSVVLTATGARAAQDAPSREVAVTAAAAVVALAAILFMGLASWELRLTPESQLFWCVAGLIVALRRMSVVGADADVRGSEGAGDA